MAGVAGVAGVGGESPAKEQLKLLSIRPLLSQLSKPNYRSATICQPGIKSNGAVVVGLDALNYSNWGILSEDDHLIYRIENALFLPKNARLPNQAFPAELCRVKNNYPIAKYYMSDVGIWKEGSIVDTIKKLGPYRKKNKKTDAQNKDTFFSG